MAPKRPDTMADMVIAECVRHRQLNALFPFWSCLVHTSYRFMNELEIRSVERGICPIATSTINERTVPIMAGCMTHERKGYISTSGLKSDVTIVFLDPDFL